LKFFGEATFFVASPSLCHYLVKSYFANLQKSAGEGGVIAKIGGVKLQKTAGIFAIMSATLSGFGKKFWNALGKGL
jgi:hypothetical protein